ncbi:hypothetical protein KBC75_02690 [Candidatus Shapirobacteria bacterium]|nr:hypothetical protein [Candidatus Shapirobacteria bacterium]
MSKLKKLSQKSWFYPLLTFILIIPAFAFLLRPGMYWIMHDDMQMIRQLELEKCFQDGQIPCRWAPDLGYGYGYPLFNFYPPMPYFVGQLFRTIGLSFMATVRYTAIANFILAGLCMYFLAANVFSPLGGLLAALFYTYAPYHAVNIYVRGAMNEAWAAVFFPLILLMAKKLIETKKLKFILFLGLSFTGLMLSHNPMTLVFTPILIIWSIYWMYFYYKLDVKKYFHSILKLASSALLAFGLAAFYTLPVILETKYVQIESMFINYYHFSVHFVTLKQLFISTFWGNGASVWGPNDGMSFAIGYLHWIIPTLIFIYYAINFIRLPKNRLRSSLILLLVFMAYFSAYMTHNQSTWLWLILTPIQKIQFPWRFLNISVLLFSLPIAVLPEIIQNSRLKQFTFPLATFLLVSLFALNISHYTPVEWGPLSDEQKFSGKAWINEITSGIYDYLPKTASKAALGPAKDFVDDITPRTVSYQVTGSKKGTDWYIGNISLPIEADVTLAILGYKDFKITNNSLPIPHTIEPEFGRIVIHLPAGNNQVYVKFVNTTGRIIANLITVITLITATIFFTKKLWTQSILKK